MPLISLRMHPRAAAVLLLAAGLLSAPAVISSAQAPAAQEKPDYLNPALPIDQRVDDLVSRMTLKEKASQLVNQARAIPRLHVPAYDYWSEALHGIGFAGVATVFPQAIALSSTWDAPLLHNVAVVIGTEGRAKHYEAVRQGRRDIFEGLTFWSPNINIFRDPRWGRGQETYGEDPYLSGRMAVAFVTGMQGDDPKYYRVIATPKHFDVHSGPESTRHTADVIVSKHDEEDTYLPAFRAAIIEGHAASTMCAYNSINGQPACANNFLLQDTLRGAWRFSGFVVSDCGAVEDAWSNHHFAKTREAGAAISLQTGMDNECIDFRAPMKDNSDYIKYLDAVKEGLLTEKQIDISLRRLFRARFMLGMFDPPQMVPYAQIPYSENDSEAHRQLALVTARESMVLLKNDGTLPLAAAPRRILVAGPLADNNRVLLGNYHGDPSRSTNALDGIRRQFPTSQITFIPGTHFLRDAKPIPESVLSTPGGKPGILGQYYRGPEFKGSPVITRIDPNIDYDFGQPPIPEFVSNVYNSENFSVRWTGYLTPSESGGYMIGATSDKGCRLYIDGNLVLDDWTHPGTRTKVVPFHFEKGRRYAIRMDYYQTKGDSVARLVWTNEVDPNPVATAVAAARNVDVVIAVVGITSDLEGEETSLNIPGFKGGDRTSLDLPKEEEDLIEGLQAAGKPLVVVLMNGSALSVNWAAQHANAILEAWYPGEEGGTAIAETIAGTNNPAGRLPVTFYTGVSQLPPFDDYSMKGRTYRYFEGKPLYPFGYGLSYSTFSYTNLKLSTNKVAAGDPLEVNADVENTSRRRGDEVVEVYITFPPIPGAPVRALRGFTRLHLDAGETQHVHFTLSPRDLSMVNPAGDRMVTAGQYRLTIGGGQPDSGAASADASFAITGKVKLPE